MTSAIDALDMSLADIIKTTKATRKSTPRAASAATGRGGKAGGKAIGKAGGKNTRSGGPTRNLRNSRDKKPYTAGAQQYKSTAAVAPLHTSVIRQNAPDGSKMQVSNLDNRVTAEDLKLVFSSRVGPLKKCTLMYDQHGKSTGTASVHFTRVGDAALAMQKFNNVPLDGRPMKIELIVASGALQKALPAAKASSGPSGKQQQQQQQKPKRGAKAPARGRGGRATRGAGREKKESKTADQLDAEMSSYMQIDA